MMDRDGQEAIASFIQEGDHFRVTTEKVIDLLPGAPMPQVIKRSSYSIIIRGALAAEAAKYLAKVECPVWATPSHKYDGCVEHTIRGDLYVLAALDKKSSQMGSADFYVETLSEEDSTTDRQHLDKAAVAQVKKFIPPFSGGGVAFPLPLRSIVEIDAPEEAKPTTPAAAGKKSLSGLLTCRPADRQNPSTSHSILRGYDMLTIHPIIAQIVDRQHVSATPRQVIRAVFKGLSKEGQSSSQRRQRKVWYRQALRAHAANGKLYGQMMAGSFY